MPIFAIHNITPKQKSSEKQGSTLPHELCQLDVTSAFNYLATPSTVFPSQPPDIIFMLRIPMKAFPITSTILLLSCIRGNINQRIQDGLGNEVKSYLCTQHDI